MDGHIEQLSNWEIDPNELEEFPLDRMGRGAFGEVYRGRYQQSEVAIKRLFMRGKRKEGSLKDFFREVQIMMYQVRD